MEYAYFKNTTIIVEYIIFTDMKRASVKITTLSKKGISQKQ